MRRLCELWAARCALVVALVPALFVVVVATPALCVFIGVGETADIWRALFVAVEYLWSDTE